MALILVVDDDAETRVLLDEALVREEGHEVRYADDGDSAIDRLAHIKPDVVITDIAMPRLNGIQLIRHLENIRCGARVIAISGKGRDGLQRAVDAGAMIALEKPVEKRDLLDALDRALDLPDPWRWGRR
ncbi:MAG TPA: response regulator [Longimicrobiales bacterium]|nr:response regulator [Longimicrobiales bacterium]